MTRFTGRAHEKLTIPSKPIPTGIKGWAVAELGYFLYWFWHARGKGPQGVECPKELKQNKTAAVVPCLLNKLPKDLQYGVYLDNLFTSTPLLKYLYEQGYGATGKARMNAGIHVDLVEKKKSDKNDIIKWGSKDLRIVAEGAVAQLG